MDSFRTHHKWFTTHRVLKSHRSKMGVIYSSHENNVPSRLSPQWINPSSSHTYHCKKGIPYSQTLRLNRIFFDNESFDKRCNDLEGWLMERGYNGKMIRKQILRAREHSRKDLLEREKAKTSKPRLTFNIPYYPVFQNIRNIL